MIATTVTDSVTPVPQS